MKKTKYIYNTHTLRYEKAVTPLWVKLLRVLGFVAAAIVSSFIIVLLAQRYFPSGNERALRTENNTLRYSYRVLQKEMNALEQRMATLEKRDNQVYRSIFESDPPPDSARQRETEILEELKNLAGKSEDYMIASVSKSLNRLHNRLLFQEKSYDNLQKLIDQKAELLAAIPAIQPVNNKDLERVASGFGYRIDPIYKIPKMHAGLDFTAPTGTPVYATADGTVSEASSTTGGYGNLVKVDHGFGYETYYAHLVRIKARAGQKVKRGEIVGWVGSTGKSTGPHLHYEVRKNGSPLDPIYFFYNDLSPEQYDRLLKIAATRNQSFD